MVPSAARFLVSGLLELEQRNDPRGLRLVFTEARCRRDDFVEDLVPLGASGARIMTTMVNALEQRGGRSALQTMCEAGGMANATIIERW